MSREATLEPCPKCGTEILETEWDPVEHVTLPRPNRADLTPLTPELETVCIITGRPTYGHYKRTLTHQIAYRDTYWHKWRHLGKPTHILPAHQCGTHLPGTPLDLTPPTYEIDPDQPCPF